MGENTKIEWAHNTLNFWVGCTPVSAGCDFCYAEKYAKRIGVEWGDKPRYRTAAATWQQAYKWNSKAQRMRCRYRVFANSLADFFDNQIDPQWRRDAWKVIRETAELDWMILTKRPQNIAKMLPWVDGRWPFDVWPWPNVWLGISAEDAKHYRQRWPCIAAIPAALRFVSYEPALGDLGPIAVAPNGVLPNLVIIGGESGKDARDTDVGCLHRALMQCQQRGIAAFVKQLGARPTLGGIPMTIRDPKGGDMSEWPRELRVREMPTSLSPPPAHDKAVAAGR